jgi:hypothetical protein
LSFEVLDCLDSTVRLTKRTPTLDGAVPLRVARGCVPLLEGNAFGFQLSLARPLRLRRRLGRWRGSWGEADARALDRMHRGGLPRLALEGLLPSPAWQRFLGRGLLQACRGGVRLFTGLLVRPDSGRWLRVTAAANRRNTLFEVEEQIIPDEDAWVPLVLELRPRRGAPERLHIEGELACLAALRPGVRFAECAIAEAPELARATPPCDRAYFEDKKED